MALENIVFDIDYDTNTNLKSLKIWFEKTSKQRNTHTHILTFILTFILHRKTAIGIEREKLLAKNDCVEWFLD